MRKDVVAPLFVLGLMLLGPSRAAAANTDARDKAEKLSVRRVSFSPDGRILAAEAGKDRRITLWDVATSKNVTPHGAQQPSGPSIFSGDGKTLLVGAERKSDQFSEIVLQHNTGAYDVATGAFLPLHSSELALLDFSPDGRTELLMTRPPRELFELRDLSKPFDESGAGNLGPLLDQQQAIAGKLKFSPDNKRLASMIKFPSPTHYQVRIWEVATRKNTANLPADVLDRFEFSSDGKAMAIRGKDGGKLFDVITGLEVANLETSADSIYPPGTLLIFSPDRKLILCDVVHHRSDSRRSDQIRCVRVLDATTGKKLVDLEKSPTSPGTWRFSADGQSVSQLFGSTITKWDLHTGAQQVFPVPARNLRFSSAPALSPDGSMLARGLADGTIRLWTVGPDAGAVKMLGPVPAAE